MDTNRLKSLFLRTLVCLLALTAIAIGSAPIGHAESSPVGYFKGDAFSTYGFTSAGPINSKLGKLTYVPCGCAGTNGQVISGSLPSLDAGATLRTQTLYSSVYTNRTASTATAKNTSEINALNALGGLITADKIVAVANTTADAATITSSDNGHVFLHLKIGGATVDTNVARNTRYNLAGFGYVIAREVKKTGDNNNGGIIVNMLHIYITTQNNLGLPVGAEIILAHAQSGFVRAPAQIQYAGVSRVVSAKALSGPLGAKLGDVAPSYVGCMGTGGNTVTNNIASLNAANVLALDNGATSAFGGPQNGAFVAKTTATVNNVNLLNGMITADVIKAVAKSTFSGGNGAGSSAGSQFVNLKVNGNPVLTVQANTKVNLAGIGYAILYQENISASTAGASTNVNMVHVYVNQSNSLGLPVGAEIIVSSAAAGVKPF